MSSIAGNGPPAKLRCCAFPPKVPEMLRVPLEEMVLQIHVLELGKAASFLQSVLEPPPQRSIEASIQSLQTVGALTENEELTPLGTRQRRPLDLRLSSVITERVLMGAAGHHIAMLPVDARIGKLLLIGAALGCLGPVLTIAACLSYKSPFEGSFDQQQAVEKARTGLAAIGAIHSFSHR